MAFTVQEVVDFFRQGFPECTEANAVALFNNARNEVLSLLPLVTDTVNITLTTAGVSTFALESSKVMKVWGVTLVAPNGTTKTTLDARDPYELLRGKDLDKVLIASEQGAPTQFYIWTDAAGMLLGLIKAPAAGDVGGSAKLIVRATLRLTPSIGDTIHDLLPSYMVYAMKMAANYSALRRHKATAFYEALYAARLDEASTYFANLTFSKKPIWPESSLPQKP